MKKNDYSYKENHHMIFFVFLYRVPHETKIFNNPDDNLKSTFINKKVIDDLNQFLLI